MNKTPPHRNNKLSRSKATYSKTPAKHANMFMIPLIIMVAIIPLIVRYHDYNTRLSIFNWFQIDDSYFDFFLYYKQLYFILTCSVMLIIIGYKIYQDKKSLKFSPIFIPLGIYGLLALLSTVFSKYSSFGFTGIFEQFESVFVLLGYCLIVYYAFIFIDTEDDVKLLIHCVLISSLVLGALGISQIIGHDFYATETGLKLILPQAIWPQLNSFLFNFGKNRVYLSLYNPNYVGVYVALIAPILICLILTAKKPKTILLYLVALVGMAISLYGSASKAGVIGLMVSFIFILILHRKYIFHKSWLTLSILTVGIVAIIIISSIKYDTISNRIHSLLKPKKIEKPLTDIKTDKDITISYNGDQLKVAYTQDANGELAFSFTDNSNKKVAYSLNLEKSIYDITDERFTSFNIAPVSYNELLCIKVQIDGKDWLFCNQFEDGTYYYMNKVGRPDKIITAASALFDGYELFATGRGYIWSRTIPLLKDYLFLGSGADTFSIVYPQQDYVNLYNYGFPDQTITKPHSMYLQIGVQTGVLSLIAFLVFYIMYFISSICLYIKGHFDSFYSQIGVAIFIGTISYMITGISNDSTITVSPVFWVMIGIGIAVNCKLSSIRIK